MYVAARKGQSALTGAARLCADEAFRRLMAHLSQEVVSQDVVVVPDLQAAVCIFSVGHLWHCTSGADGQAPGAMHSAALL